MYIYFKHTTRDISFPKLDPVHLLPNPMSSSNIHNRMTKKEKKVVRKHFAYLNLEC